MNLNCDFIRIDGTVMPGVAGISVEHDMLRSVVRTLGGSLQVDRLVTAGVSNAWTVQFGGLSEQEKSFILFHVLSDSGVRRVAFFNTAGFDALVSVTRDEYVPRWDSTRTYRQHASGLLTLRVEALALTSPFTTGGVYAELMSGELVFRSGVQVAPSTFTRASQAWDGSGLVAPDTMRVFGRDTKSPVVLIEGQRTNVLTNSSSPTDGWAAPTRIDVTPAGEGPRGAAYKIIPQDGHTQSTYLIKTPPLHSPGNAVVFSACFAAAGLPSVWISDATGFTVSGHPSSGFNLQPGTIFAESEGGEGTIKPVQGWPGWYYCELVIPEAVGDSIMIRVTKESAASLDSSAANGVDGVLVSGFNYELAPFASSYIPADGAPATRAADNFSVDHAIDSGGDWTVHLALQFSEAGVRGVYRRFFNMGTSASGPWADDRFATGLGSTISGGHLDGPPHVLTWRKHGDVCQLFDNGELLDTGPPLLIPSAGVITVGNRSGSGHVFGLVGPGAAQLGIPFIDNRAWSAEEIQAAHARWLPELESIEVPV